MNRLIRIGIFWCLAISIASAQEADTSKDESNQRSPDQPQAEGTASVNSQAVVATTMAAETELPANSPIKVTLSMRKDESYDKIKQLMEALRNAGVQQMSLRLGGVMTEGEEERNTLILHLQQGFRLHELQKIESAANSKAAQCGLRLFIVTQNLAQPAGEFFRPTVPQLRTDYEAANKQAHDLAESLRQTPEAAKKAELRAAVQRAFTLRQSLLRAELKEMQARLEKTQQSLDMRDRIANQIVDRRVEDLLNLPLKWDNDGPIESTPPITSTANAPSTLETVTPITELEGDWHLVGIADEAGDPMEARPANLSFREDRYTLAYQGYQNEWRIEVYPDEKEIRYFADGDDAFTRDRYLLEGDLLTIVDESQRRIYARGHVALPKSIPKATGEQKSRWRSGIVEILTQDTRGNTHLVGYGVIVSPQMSIVSQVRLSDGDSAFFARFDDGGIVSINFLEEGPQGWVTFEFDQRIEANHHFRFSEATIGEGDEVHFWGRDATVSENPRLELFETTVKDLDRKAPALGQTVWQLFRHDHLDGSLPILDANGELLAITIAGTNDLLLAVPVAELKIMFPNSIGSLSGTENHAEPAVNQ